MRTRRAADVQSRISARTFNPPELRATPSATSRVPNCGYSSAALNNSLRSGALQSRTDTVPTEAERDGDFSHTFRLVGGQCVPVQIYDPTTTQPNPNGPGFIRSPFANAIIPKNRFDKAGSTLANLYPLPTSAGDACTGVNNYFATGTQSYDTDEFDGKMDWSPNEKNHLFFAASSFSPVTINPNLYGTIADPNGLLIGGSRGPAKVARIDYKHIYGPTLTSNLRFGIVRWTLNTKPYPSPFDPASVGFSPSLGPQMSQPTTFPNINVSGYSALGSSVGFINQASTSYNWKGSISKVWKSHNLKTGGEYRIIQTYEYSGLGTNGSFSFGPAYTQGPDPDTANSHAGDGIASLVLGTGTGNVQIFPNIFTSSHYSALFVQDQWKITLRFSVEMGLRWEYETPRRERSNRLSYWDFNVASPLAQEVPSMPNLHGGLRFVGKDSSTQFDPDWNNFGPRFGVAYSLDRNTVIRAGPQNRVGIKSRIHQWLTRSFGSRWALSCWSRSASLAVWDTKPFSSHPSPDLRSRRRRRVRSGQRDSPGQVRFLHSDGSTPPACR